MVFSCSIGIPYSWWESHELVLFGLQVWERMFLLFLLLFVLFLTFGFYGSTQLHKYSYLFLAQAPVIGCFKHRETSQQLFSRQDGILPITNLSSLPGVLCSLESHTEQGN